MTTIIMTGGSSGFGATTAQQLRQSPDTRLVVGARSPSVDSDYLDLTSLNSVRAFASSVTERFCDAGIDALVLNAGTIQSDDTERTTDGYETTFAVNHLAHYLLVRLLLPTLAKGARVVLTTSGTHDPAERGSLATPRHAHADLLAHPDLDPSRDPREAGERAYTASKMCNILTTRTLQGRPDIAARSITVVAYCPGQVFGTGLTRDLAAPLRIAWSVLGTPLGAPLRRLDRTRNTRKDAGEALANLALARVTPPDGRSYAALRRGRLTWPDPSELARNHDAGQKLWIDSARLIGLPD